MKWWQVCINAVAAGLAGYTTALAGGASVEVSAVSGIVACVSILVGLFQDRPYRKG